MPLSLKVDKYCLIRTRSHLGALDLESTFVTLVTDSLRPSSQTVYRHHQTQEAMI